MDGHSFSQYFKVAVVSTYTSFQNERILSFLYSDNFIRGKPEESTKEVRELNLVLLCRQDKKGLYHCYVVIIKFCVVKVTVHTCLVNSVPK